jgi:hypothetical protein
MTAALPVGAGWEAEDGLKRKDIVVVVVVVVVGGIKKYDETGSRYGEEMQREEQQ